MSGSEFNSRSKSAWGWQPPRQEGVWKHGGCAWAKPLVCAAPWIALGVVFFIFTLIAGRLSLAEGTVFNLPEGDAAQNEVPALVALAVPVPRGGNAAGEETLIFFDDARYTLSDESSLAAFKSRLEQRAAADRTGVLLLLADRRVTAGELVRLVGVARASGVKHVQLAEKRE